MVELEKQIIRVQAILECVEIINSPLLTPICAAAKIVKLLEQENKKLKEKIDAPKKRKI